MRPLFKTGNFISLVFLLLVTPDLVAQEAVGQVVYVHGEVTVSRPTEPTPRLLKFDDDLYEGDTLETRNGQLRILLNDRTVLSLSNNSKILITEQRFDPAQGVRKSVLDMIKGTFRTIVERVVSFQTDDVRLQTPTAVAGIRGTDVGILILGGVTYYLCFDGHFLTWYKGAPDETQTVGTGEYTRIDNAPPTPPEPIPPDLLDYFLDLLKLASLQDLLDMLGLGVGEEALAKGGEEPFPKTPEPPVLTVQPDILPGGLDAVPFDTGVSGGGGDSGGGGGGEPFIPPPTPPAPTEGPVNVPANFPEKR